LICFVRKSHSVKSRMMNEWNMKIWFLFLKLKNFQKHYHGVSWVKDHGLNRGVIVDCHRPWCHLTKHGSPWSYCHGQPWCYRLSNTMVPFNKTWSTMCYHGNIWPWMIMVVHGSPWSYDHHFHLGKSYLLGGMCILWLKQNILIVRIQYWLRNVVSWFYLIIIPLKIPPCD